MPYRNIVFVKLEKRLLNDHRWFTMSEPAQLIYVKMILLAAETYNKIPLNDNILREALRSRLDLKTFQGCLKEIEQNFPKLRKNKHFRYFDEFDTKTNYIPKREIPRKSQGLPKVGADKEEDKDQDQDKEEDKEKSTASPALKAALDKVYKEGLNIYALLNKLKKESKVSVELPEEVLFRVCESYSKNKDTIKEEWPWFCRAVVAEWERYNADKNIRESQEFKQTGMAQSIKEILCLK